MAERKFVPGPGEEAAQSDRRLKQAIICFAVVEFIVLALVIYHKLAG